MIDKALICRKKNVVLGTIGDLLSESPAGGEGETNHIGGVGFVEALGEVVFGDGHVGGGGDSEGGGREGGEGRKKNCKDN